MDKRKTIIVWMDGKKTRITKNNNGNQNEPQPNFTREHAATKEDNGEYDPIPTYTRQNTLENEVDLKKGKKQKDKRYKHIFFATISAILLGAGLGIFMLNMFTNIDMNTIGEKINPQTEKTSSESNNASSGAVATDLSTYKLKSIQAFVLQAGLFNDETNLKAVQDKFKEAGFLTVAWKRDNQYYLFANIGETKDQTDTKKAKYKEMNLETYAKEWNTKETEVKLTKSEYQWLQNFHDLWNKSLKRVSNNESISSTEWSKWIESYPNGGEKTVPFHEKVKSIQSDLKDANQITSPAVLLTLWNQFENIILS